MSANQAIVADAQFGASVPGALPAQGRLPVAVLGDSLGNLIATSDNGNGTSSLASVKLFRDAQVSLQKGGSVTAPLAGGNIATVTIVTAGLYEVTVWYFLSGTVAAGDANNFEILQNATARFALLPMPAVVDVLTFPVTLLLSCAATDTISVAAIGAGTASAVYNAAIVARRVG